jgi:hypothetical protein
MTQIPVKAGPPSGIRLPQLAKGFLATIGRASRPPEPTGFKSVVASRAL